MQNWNTQLLLILSHNPAANLMRYQAETARLLLGIRDFQDFLGDMP